MPATSKKICDKITWFFEKNMDCENMFSEYKVLEKTRFFRIKGFGKNTDQKMRF